MRDSFFTSRNQVDPQVEHASVIFCDELVEASVRRIAKLEGPFEAAKRLQRIADICAGAYVLPIDHWKSLGGTDAPEKPVKPNTRPRSRRERIIQNVAAHGHWFAAGMMFSMALTAFQAWWGS